MEDGYCVVTFPMRIDLIMTLVYRAVSPMDRLGQKARMSLAAMAILSHKHAGEACCQVCLVAFVQILGSSVLFLAKGSQYRPDGS